jgi:K+-transporting ATPase A subunit
MFDLLFVIVLPFAIIFMFGRLIGRPRQAYAIIAVMAIIFVGHTAVSMQAERHRSSPSSSARSVRAGTAAGFIRSWCSHCSPSSSPG